MKKIGAIICLIFIISSFVVSISATHQFDESTRQMKIDLNKVKSVTQKYHNYKNAIRDGYTAMGECVEVPRVGAMGIHYVNLYYLDSTLDIRKPESLLYIPTKRGLKLVGVEYFIPSATVSRTPQLFGQLFDGPMQGHSPGQPEHYDLHVWIWDNNPSGMFEQFNPNLYCETRDIVIA